MKTGQRPLALSWRDGGHYDDYYAGQTNAAAVELLRNALDTGDCSICLHGPLGSGRTHLLLAACDEAQGGAQYLSLKRDRAEAKALLEQQPPVDLLCLDDAQHLLGVRDSEKALFDVHNRIRDAGGCLLLTEDSNAGPTAFALPDLASRWRGATHIHLRDLNDEELARGWTMRARLRGLQPDKGVINWLLTHRPRNFYDWMTTLDQLDSAALAQGRRLTVPFVRDQLISN